MRLVAFLWVGVLTFGFVDVSGAAGQDAPRKEAAAIDLALARRSFEEAKALSDADAGRLWGKPLYGPMLFVDPATRQVVANERDGGRILREGGVVWVGTLPPEQAVANTALAWSGTKWTMLMWPLPQDRYARGKLMMHELFHRIQNDLGLPETDADNSHLGGRDGRIWLRLEWRALHEALIREGDKRRHATADALVFRAYRRTLFPKAADAERLMELHEGLAEYTGFRLGGLPLAVLPDRAAVHIAQQEIVPTFVRSFAYASGPAYGLLLDAAGQDWRPVARLKPDLGDLLAKALKVSLPDDVAREAELRANDYDDGRVIAAETRREESRQRVQAQFQARFIDGPVLELTATKQVSYSFDPNAVEVFDRDGGTVYVTTQVTDEWGVLTVTSGGVLMLRGADRRVTGWRLPAPADPKAQPAKGDGWTLKLAKGWSLQPGTRRGDWLLKRVP
jgi:phage tail protein X